MKRARLAMLIIGSIAALDLRAGDPPLVIGSLASIPIRYVEDGAADATVVAHPEPRVKAIVDLGEKALPVLIECLVSRESTSAIAVTSHSIEQTTQVPLGYLCLDILMLITDSPEIYVKECADDGLGACVTKTFYFRPDIYANPSGVSHARTQVAAVQNEWRNAFKRGTVKFVYPSWWTESAQ